MELKNQIYRDNWKKYLQLGLIPYPASNDYKGPIVSWKKDENGDPLPPPVTDDFLFWQDEYPDANLWVLIGSEISVIDPDGDGAESFVQSLNLPKGPVSISGGKSKHRWFKNRSGLEYLKVLNGEDKTFIEVRTGNLGMFVPPSVHPETKKPYRWMEGHSPWEIPFPELPIEAYQKIQALEQKPDHRENYQKPQMNSIPEGSLDVVRYLIFYKIQFIEKKEANRTIYALKTCLWAENHTTKNVQGDSSIIQGIDGKLGYQCFHNHCQQKTWADARKKISEDEPLTKFLRGYPEPKTQVNVRGGGKSLSEILNELEVEEKYVVKPILSRGDKGYIVSSYKMGKTLFLTQLTLCLSM